MLFSNYFEKRECFVFFETWPTNRNRINAEACFIRINRPSLNNQEKLTFSTRFWKWNVWCLIFSSQNVFSKAFIDSSSKFIMIKFVHCLSYYLIMVENEWSENFTVFFSIYYLVSEAIDNEHLENCAKVNIVVLRRLTIISVLFFKLKLENIFSISCL
jgi:hypothetical protein